MRFGLALVLALFVAVPAAAVAKPSRADVRNAVSECRAERDALGTELFADKYRRFGRCVRKTAREERAERRSARREAIRECRDEGLRGRELGRCIAATARENEEELDAEDAEEFAADRACREEMEADEAAFREKYGENHTKDNAFGMCVSSEAREGRGGRPEGTGPPEGEVPPEGGEGESA